MNYRIWNERYASDEYAYGTEPNSFLAEHVHLLTGSILSLAEGEGRNAVFLAAHGLDVLGVDNSEVGLAKAAELARSRGVQIRTQLVDLNEFQPEPNAYDAVVSIWAHLPSTVRDHLYPRLVTSLKPHGLLLLESYSTQQLERNTGGPKDLDLLMSVEKIKQALSGLEHLVLREIERDVCEGKFHTGLASVVQFIGRKR